jgi:hypothetical protein
VEIYSGSIMVSAITASPHSSFFFLYSDKHSGTFLIVPGARQSAAELFCPLITKPRKCTVPASTARKPVDEQADPKEASKKKRSLALHARGRSWRESPGPERAGAGNQAPLEGGGGMMGDIYRRGI